MGDTVPWAVAGRGVVGVAAGPRSLAGIGLQLVLGLGVRAAHGRVGVLSRRQIHLGAAAGCFLALRGDYIGEPLLSQWLTTSISHLQ
jgi:hypothetical protein